MNPETTAPAAVPEPADPWSWKGLVASGWAFPIGLVLLLVLLFSARQIANCDLGTDLKTGQWILRHHGVPQKDPFTYSVPGNDYLDGKVLYQLLVYGLQRLGGYPPITLANMAVIFAVFLLLLARMRWTGAGPACACVLLLLCAFILERRFYVRAEPFSWLYFSLVLAVLERRSVRQRTFLFLLPLVQALWVNTEGLFVLEWALLGLYGVGDWIRLRAPDKPLWKTAGLCLAASLLNPYGPKLLRLPFLYLGELGSRGDSDLVSPLAYLAHQNLKIDWNLQLFLYFALSAFLILGSALTFRNRKPVEWGLLSVFFLLSCWAYRNIPFFVLACAPLGARLAQDGLPRLRRFFPAGGGRGFPWAAAVFVFLTASRVCTNAYYISDRRMTRLGLGLGQIPVKAVDFLVQNHLDGRLLNDPDMGDWLIWKGTQPVFIDGRRQVMGHDLLAEYQDSLTRGGVERLCLKYHPQMIACQYNDTMPWAVQMAMMPGWRLLYADGSWAIYGAPGYAPELPTFSFPSVLAERHILLGQPEMEMMIQEADPSAFHKWLEGFVLPQHYPLGLLSLGLFALHNGDNETAGLLFAECLRQAGDGYFEIFFNLGVANLRMRRPELGRECMEKALVLNPSDPETRRALKDLSHFPSP
jgi:hypothetical protein